MKIYIALLLVVLINIFFETRFSIFKIKNFRVNSRNLSFFSCFIFILLLGILRHERLGVDVEIYKKYFLSTYSNTDFKFFIGNFNYDIGYVALNKIVKIFTNNFRVFEVITFCISFCIFSLIIYKESKYPALSFLIYIALDFIGFNMCILRQSIACALCFLAYYYLENNKKVKYIFLFILAITFHKTAIFFSLTYLLSLNREKVSSYAINIFIILIFYFGFNSIFPRLIGIYSNDYSNMIVTGQGFNIFAFYLIVIILMRFICSEELSQKDIMRYECSLGTLYMQVGALSFALFTRITRYFAIFFTLSVPNMIYKSKYKSLYIIVYCIMFSLLYLYVLYSNETNIVPYKSVFNII